MTPTVLVDNSILSHGEFATPISVELPGFGNRLALLKAKAAQPKWLRSQIETLPTIARLAREEGLELYSYSELQFEHFRGASFPGNVIGNVFGRVFLKNIDAPIQRSLFEQTEMKQFVGNEFQASFCAWLMKVGPELLKKPKLLERLTESQISALKGLGRYREICRSLSSVQYVDAMHLWTGELNNIEYFLTTDGKLVRALSNNKRLTLTCKPIYPEDLLLELGIKDREPLPFQYGRRYYISGVPYD
jgi:hypothetical protein